MHLLVEADAAAVAARGAQLLAGALLRPQVRTLQPATGNSPQALYRLLPEQLGPQRAAIAARLTVFQMDEYIGLDGADDRSLYGWMVRGLTDPLGVPRDRVIPLLQPGLEPSRSCKEFDRRLNAAGGLDVLVAGLGPNGHLGFNEPPCAPDAPSRVVDLTPASVVSNATYWGSTDRVPRRAATTGMAAMLAAQAILLVVVGAHKRSILSSALTGPISPHVPASYLQRCPHALVLADRAACSHELQAEFHRRHRAPPRMNSPIFFGLDAGNSKTLAVVVAADGAVLGESRGGCGDHYAGDGSLDTLHEVARAALDSAGVSSRDVAGAACCLAGADWPEDHARLELHLGSLGWGGPLQVHNDALGALRGCSRDGVGLVLVCGTFATVAARAPSGPAWAAGPWCTAGGSRDIGRRGLHAAVHARLGAAPATRITDHLLREFPAERIDTVLHRFTSRQPDGRQPSLGLIAPAVIAAADSGDATAIAILENAADDVIKSARGAVSSVRIQPPFPVFLAGGMHRAREHAWERILVGKALEAFPGCEIGFARMPPVGGAALLAMEACGRTVSSDVFDRLAAALDKPLRR